jgi:flavorubredoxin
MSSDAATMDTPQVVRGKDGFPREIAPGIWWLGGCFPMRADDGRGYDTGGVKEIHSHVASYLVVGADKALMVDTGTPANWKEVSGYLDQILGSRPLDWIVPTHWEVPHAGNLEKLFDKYPNSQAGGDLRDFHLAYPQYEARIHILDAGHTLDLGGGVRFVVLPAPVKDLVNSVWGYEAREQVMFTADGFSYTHRVGELTGDEEEVHIHHPGECSLMSHEIGIYPTVEQALFLTKAALYWTRLTPVEPFFAEMDALLAKYPTKFIAPSHGNVISDIDKMMPIIRQAHDIAYAQGATT